MAKNKLVSYRERGRVHGFKCMAIAYIYVLAVMLLRSLQ